MNTIFEFKRFCKFFSFEFRRLAITSWRQLLSQAMAIPVAVFVYGTVNLIASGTFVFPEGEIRMAIMFMALFISLISIPSHLYGKLTDKKLGSEFILMPASLFEKFLTMLINLVIIFPFILFALPILSDLLLVMFSPGTESILSCLIKESSSNQIIPDSDINLFVYAIQDFFALILIFTIGALYFKKNKIAGTILALFIIAIIAVIPLSWILTDSDVILWLNNIIESENFWYSVKVLDLIKDFIVNLALATVIFFRLKRIQY